MATRSRSSAGTASAASRSPRTWSSSTPSERDPATARSWAEPRPGVPRPSMTTTAKPWSANHWDEVKAAQERATRRACGPPYESTITGSGEPSWSRGSSTATEHHPSSSSVTSGRTSGVSLWSARAVPSGSIQSAEWELSEVVRVMSRPPPTTAEMIPSGWATGRLPLPSIVHRCNTVGSSTGLAVNTTPWSSAATTDRTWSPSWERGSPSTQSRRLPSRSSQVTRRPPGSSAGAPGTRSTHESSSMARITAVEPDSGSASTTSRCRWLRSWVVRRRPSGPQFTEARYSAPEADQSISVLFPESRSTMWSETAAFVVPAAG